MTIDLRSKASSIIIACHSDKTDGRRGSGSGPVEPLLRYLLKRNVRWIFLIEQPHPNVTGALDCTLEVYHEGELLATHTTSPWRFLYDIPPHRRRCRTYIRLKLRDAISVWFFLRLLRRRYADGLPAAYFIGVESVNALAARLFGSGRLFARIVYYLFDWSPRRYANRLLNALYIKSDRLACRHSDFTWNITPAIEQSRRNDLNYGGRELHSQMTVLYGAEFRRHLVRPFEDLDPLRVVFTGGLHADNGGHLLPEIALRLQQQDPRVRLTIVGDGPQMPLVRSEMTRLGVQNTQLVGHVSDPEEIDRLQCRFLIGLAPYPDTPTTTKRWGDVIKIRSYLSCGLVVVTTKIPPVWREIDAEGLGVVTDESPILLADAVLRLCHDPALLRQFRDSVVRKAEMHSWTHQFDRAFINMSGDGAP